MHRPTSWAPKHKTQILCCAVWCDSAPRARHRIKTPGIIPQKRGASNPELAIGGVEWNRLVTNQMRLGQWASAWGIFQSLVNLCAHTQRAQLTVLHTCQYTQVPIRSTDDSPGFTSDQGQEYQLYMGARSGPNVTAHGPGAGPEAHMRALATSKDCDTATHHIVLRAAKTPCWLTTAHGRISRGQRLDRSARAPSKARQAGCSAAYLAGTSAGDALRQRLDAVLYASLPATVVV